MGDGAVQAASHQQLQPQRERLPKKDGAIKKTQPQPHCTILHLPPGARRRNTNTLPSSCPPVACQGFLLASPKTALDMKSLKGSSPWYKDGWRNVRDGLEEKQTNDWFTYYNTFDYFTSVIIEKYIIPDKHYKNVLCLAQHLPYCEVGENVYSSFFIFLPWPIRGVLLP